MTRDQAEQLARRAVLGEDDPHAGLVSRVMHAIETAVAQFSVESQIAAGQALKARLSPPLPTLPDR